MQWYTIFEKELVENWRNRKWIWVPLVFILVAVMDPVTYYFLPQIIELSGGLPEGAVLEMPKMQPAEVAATSLESLSTYGIVILALFTMGAISGEIKSGVIEMILVKPVKYSHYITAKWSANALLILTALFLGIGLSWYYVNLLFGKLSVASFFLTVLLFVLWFCLFLSISLFYNVLFKAPGAVAACTIGTYFLMNFADMIMGNKWSWFPNQMFNHLQEVLMTKHVTGDIWGTAFIMLLTTVILLVIAITIFRKKEISH